MKKLETKSTVLLKHHLKALKMPSMHDECEKVAARCAKERCGCGLTAQRFGLGVHHLVNQRHLTSLGQDATFKPV